MPRRVQYSLARDRQKLIVIIIDVFVGSSNVIIVIPRMVVLCLMLSGLAVAAGSIPVQTRIVL